jgi:SAM-dependent methyltransferase
MTPDERALRARSFGAIAERYDRFRPGPPPDAVDWLLADTTGERLDAPIDAVVDLGAGTGALSRLLVGRAGHVYAVEPDERMAAVLADRVPEVEVRSGQAESLPLPDASVDAVLGSSMWHWVDEARAAAEVARVLRPGGTFGLLWSGPDRSHEWVADLLAQANPRRARAETAETAETAADARRRRHEVHLPPDAPFAPPETRLLRWTMTVTLDELAGLAGTFSVVIRLPESERAGLQDRLYGYVRDHPPPGADRDEIELPMRCYCWKTRRR